HPSTSFHRSLGKVTRSIEQRVANPHLGERERSALRTLLDRLQSPDAVMREIRTMLGAGATTVHLLSWIMLLLATHPDKQELLPAEVLAQLGDARSYTLTQLEALPYLTAVIQEGLRLYPPAPYLIRKVKPHERDYGKARSSVYLFSVWAMHR